MCLQQSGCNKSSRSVNSSSSASQGTMNFLTSVFKAFFAATALAQDQANSEANRQRLLQNWTGAAWRETVLLYTAQLSPKALDRIIRQACALGSEAAELAAVCLQEYPRPEKVQPELIALLQSLDQVTQDSKYQRLDTLLKAQDWKAADHETYRLMITTVDKEEGQYFTSRELLNFPCEELKAIDRLWLTHSQGRFGFSVQKNLYLDCGGIPDGKYHQKAWDKFCHMNGWKEKGSYVTPTYTFGAPRGPLSMGTFSFLVWRIYDYSLLSHQHL